MSRDREVLDLIRESAQMSMDQNKEMLGNKLDATDRILGQIAAHMIINSASEVAAGMDPLEVTA